MYLQEFSLDQRKALVLLAYHMMVADDRIRPEEQAMIKALEHELNINDQLLPAEFLLPPDTKVFTDRRTRVAVLLKLYALAHADKEFHQREKNMLEELGTQFGFTQAELDRMNQWGLSHSDLVAVAEDLSLAK